MQLWRPLAQKIKKKKASGRKPRTKASLAGQALAEESIRGQSPSLGSGLKTLFWEVYQQEILSNLHLRTQGIEKGQVIEGCVGKGGLLVGPSSAGKWPPQGGWGRESSAGGPRRLWFTPPPAPGSSVLQAVFSPGERHRLRTQHCPLQLGFGQGSVSLGMEGDLACKRTLQAQSNC